jgi:hypothetical protein
VVEEAGSMTSSARNVEWWFSVLVERVMQGEEVDRHLHKASPPTIAQ